MIPPEVRQAIDASLSTLSTNIPAAHLETVETSRGTKTVTTIEDRMADVDDAVEPLDKNRPGNTKLPAQPKREPSRQPTYIKSVAQPVVPSANPSAPYGHDENDRPILPGRSDQQIATDLLAKPDLLTETTAERRKPKNNVRTTVLRDLMHDYDRVQVRVVSEAELRRQFGLPMFNPSVKIETSKFVHYPTLLGLTRKKLVELLDVQVEVEVLTETDLSQQERVLKSTVEITNQIATLENNHANAEVRIAELKQLITESEKLIDSWSVRVMKAQIKRGERQPEDILDKNTREQFKREETKLIETYRQEKCDLEKQLRSPRLAELKNRLVNWGSGPDDYELKPLTREREMSIPLESVLRFTFSDFFKGRLPDGYDKPGPDAYKQLVYQYEESKSIFRGWESFENFIVLGAIAYGLIRLPEKVRELHPSLCVGHEPDVDDPEQDDPEIALIIQTGGAQIGGTVYSAGHRDGKTRPLESFDKRKPGGSGEYGGPSPDNFFGGMDSGDLDERAADE